MSNATDIREARGERSPEEIAAALRGEWRMIAAVSLRPCRDGEGFEADLRLDPTVVKGSLEQQGHPRTSDASEKLEGRRQVALEDCVRRVNATLPAAKTIQNFRVIG